METSLSIALKAPVVTPAMPLEVRKLVREVPPAKPATQASTLPADRVFVAQVVAARLSGTAFPENPSEIAPAERTLKPYNVPMLPSDGKDGASDPYSVSSDTDENTPRIETASDASRADGAGESTQPIGASTDVASTFAAQGPRLTQ